MWSTFNVILSGVCWLLASSANIRQGWKVLPWKKLSSLFGLFVIQEENSCISWTPGKIILKHFTVVIYKCSKYARVLVPGKPLKPSSLV